MKRTLALAMILPCGLFCTPDSPIKTVIAAPNHEDFDAALDVQGGAESQKLVQTAQTLYENCNKAMQTFADRANRGNVERIKADLVAQTYVSLEQLMRLAEQLELMGEAAGRDYHLRANYLMGNLNDFITTYRSTEAAGLYNQRAAIVLDKRQQAEARDIATVQRLIQQEKWLEAETAFFRVRDAVSQLTALMNVHQYFQQFHSLEPPLTSRLRTLRQEEARKRLDAAIQQQSPDYGQLLQEIDGAASQVQASGAADYRGAMLTGPQLVEQFGERWRQLHVATLRCRALEWTRASLPDDADEAAAGPADDPFAAEYAKFVSQITRSLCGIVEADSQRASEAAAAELYQQYLTVLVPLATKTPDDTFTEAANAALEKLAAKAPAFAGDVKAYRAATDDLLRWKERTARTLAGKQADLFPPIGDLFITAARSTDEANVFLPPPGQEALGQVAMHPEFLGSAPEAMPVVCNRLMGNQAAALAVKGVGSQGRVSYACLHQRTYVRVPVPQQLDPAAEALRNDLLVTDTALPLSLAGLIALESTGHGDFEAVGGTVTGAFLEGLLPRMATLPEAAFAIVPLGPLPAEPTNVDLLGDIVMRFDIDPAWVRHRYFFVDLSGS